jgi:hypothetical protein
VRGGEVELVEKLGRNDPCPCGSGKRFQGLLPDIRMLSMGSSGMIIGGSEGEGDLKMVAAACAIFALIG